MSSRLLEEGGPVENREERDAETDETTSLLLSLFTSLQPTVLRLQGELLRRKKRVDHST